MDLLGVASGGAPHLKKFIRWPRLSNISMHPPGKSIESVNQKNNFGLQTQYNVYKICPVCMNYGYHSILHEIECIDYCVFHKCNLIKINHKQFDESRFGTYEFWNVKTENIVNNSCLADEIVKFKQKQEKERSIFNKYFFRAVWCERKNVMKAPNDYIRDLVYFKTISFYTVANALFPYPWKISDKRILN